MDKVSGLVIAQYSNNVFFKSFDLLKKDALQLNTEMSMNCFGQKFLKTISKFVIECKIIACD